MRKLRIQIGPGARHALLTIAITLAFVYAVFASTVLWAMRQPPETFGKVMAKMPGPIPFLLFPFEFAWTHARAGNLKIGEQAPDFSLNKLDKSGFVKLSELNATQPVVLIFGSYT